MQINKHKTLRDDDCVDDCNYGDDDCDDDDDDRDLFREKVFKFRVNNEPAMELPHEQAQYF